MIHDTAFLNSGFCNINLIDQKECPLVAQLIYENYLNQKESEKEPPKTRVSTHYAGSRPRLQISESIKGLVNESHKNRSDYTRNSIQDTQADTQSQFPIDTKQSIRDPDLNVQSILSNPRSSMRLPREMRVGKENQHLLAQKQPTPTISTTNSPEKQGSNKKGHNDNNKPGSNVRSPDKILDEPPMPRESQTQFSKFQVESTNTLEDQLKEPTEPMIPDVLRNTAVPNSRREEDENTYTKELENDPFIKRLNELKGVYMEMKKQIQAQEDNASNFFSNIKKPTVQDTAPGYSNISSMEASLHTNDSHLNLGSINTTQSPNYKLPPVQPKLNMISGQELREKRLQKIAQFNSNLGKITNPSSGKNSRKSSGERASSAMRGDPGLSYINPRIRPTEKSIHEESQGSLISDSMKPPRPFSFGKQRLSVGDNRPVKRPDPREVKEKYTNRPVIKENKANKTIDIITLNDIRGTNMDPHERSFESLIPPPRDYTSSQGSSKDRLAPVKKPEILMPIKVRSKSALRVLKDVSPDDKFEYDESYIELCENLSAMLANYSIIRNTPDADIGINTIVTEFRKNNPMLLKLSHFTVSEIIRSCNVLIFKNQTIYQEGEHNRNTYIILYGAVYLKSKMMGLFKQCLIGDSLAEESVLEQRHTKLETAKVVDETAVVEIPLPFMEKLKVILKESYPSDFMILTQCLKKNLMQKKSLRAIGSLKV